MPRIPENRRIKFIREKVDKTVFELYGLSLVFAILKHQKKIKSPTNFTAACHKTMWACNEDNE